jgi:hypothetical protein
VKMRQSHSPGIPRIGDGLLRCHRKGLRQRSECLPTTRRAEGGSAEQGASLGFSQYVVADGQGLARRSNWRSGSPPCDAEKLRRVAGAPAYRPVRSRASDGEPDDGGRFGDAKMRIQDFLQKARCHGVPSRAGAADAALRYRGLTPRDPVVRVQDAEFEACRIGLLAGSVHARTFGVAERCWTKSLRLFATTLTRAKLSRSVSYAPMRPLQRI